MTDTCRRQVSVFFSFYPKDQFGFYYNIYVRKNVYCSILILFKENIRLETMKVKEKERGKKNAKEN